MVSVCVRVCVLRQRLERTQLDQREQMQHLRAEQQLLQQQLAKLTGTGHRHQLTSSGPLDVSSAADAGHQYRVHSSLSESSSGSLTSSTGYSSWGSEQGRCIICPLLLSVLL